MRDVTGALSASGLAFTLVVSRFNSYVTERLLDGAVDALKRAGAKDDAISVLRVPGAWELPFAVKKAIEAKPRPDAVIALGCVIRGGTPHFEYVSRGAVDGCMRAQLDSGIPVSLGVLTCDDAQQAIARSRPVGEGKPPEITHHVGPSGPPDPGAPVDHGNKGFEAALAAIEMANLAKQLR